MQEKLHIHYSNDLHSHFENWGKIVHHFEQKKRRYQNHHESFWLIDLGDHVDRYHPIAEAYRGKKNVEFLNQAGYDVVTIGNNEGITLEYDDLYQLYNQADFQVTCGNLSPSNEERPSWLRDDVLLTTSSGIRIRLIGLTAPFNAFYHELGWHVQSPYDYLDQHIRRIKKDADVIILLSHLGLSEDENIAYKYPEIDVIIGGHTHHLLKSGKTVNQTLLTAAGKHGAYVGEVHLNWDHRLQQLVEKEAYAVETEQMDSDKKTDKLIHTTTESAVAKLSETKVTISQQLKVDWFSSTQIVQSLTAMLKQWTGADVAMLNAGLLLESLGPGKVTFADIHRICPHPINPCTVTLDGAELMEVIRGAHDPQLTQLALKGFGFRGEVIGAITFWGIEIDRYEDETGKTHVRHAYWQGHPIDLHQTYTLATADMFTFGHIFPAIARATTKQFYLPEFMRDLLWHTLSEDS
ncbi:metallophosphoesterase [Gracilibacillus halophilus YIM-C55.5]|uniref:Metallophosphoesterase n=1 Tax=Gracilibacillus halophilus YIM-C55.5 TaxID=1308866 RepID=N4WC49_9BACI|nr:bifunctional UDP-sugar hydrolase/5'-nucleotidase [Gracilibacillus halophilus]ENH96829.1 metallophosphoesterase [Gracilibacillus halophilus YIM-C55.5]